MTRSEAVGVGPRPGVRRRGQITMCVPGTIPDPPAALHRLCLNESPFGPLPAVSRALTNSIMQTNRYPEFYPERLTELIADRLGLATGSVAVGSGSVGQLARVKKQTIIRAAAVLVVLGILGRLAWTMILSAPSHMTLQSPDKRFVVHVTSRYWGDFWGGAPHDRHAIQIESVETKRVHRLLIDDRYDGWPLECSAQWAANDSSVTLIFKHEDMEMMRLVLAVYR